MPLRSAPLKRSLTDCSVSSTQYLVFFLFLAALAGCNASAAKPQAAAASNTGPKTAAPPQADARKQFAGSKTCYDCHTKFYDIWSTSRHGLAMQPYSAA